MHVLIFEHICGGGMVQQPLLESLQPLGMAMLRAVTEDMLGVGCQVTVTLDARVTWTACDAHVRIVQPEESIHEVLSTMSKTVDAVLLIAPEMQGIHSGYARALETARARLLGCASGGIRMCSDKLSLGLKLARSGVPTPPTMIHRPGLTLDEPLVIKPRSGAGCELTWLCRTQAELERAAAASSTVTMIAQRYVPGMPVSAALIVHPGAAIQALRAGQQQIVISDEGVLKYQGGRIPLDPHLEARAMELATRAISHLPGLRGFVGVDLVLGESPAQDSVIEINPRITMAYTGLRHLSQSNLALALLDPGHIVQWNSRSVSFDANGHASVHNGAIS